MLPSCSLCESQHNCCEWLLLWGLLPNSIPHCGIHKAFFSNNIHIHRYHLIHNSLLVLAFWKNRLRRKVIFGRLMHSWAKPIHHRPTPQINSVPILAASKSPTNQFKPKITLLSWFTFSPLLHMDVHATNFYINNSSYIGVEAFLEQVCLITVYWNQLSQRALGTLFSVCGSVTIFSVMLKKSFTLPLLAWAPKWLQGQSQLGFCRQNFKYL